ncbi:MAG: DUF4430 domain-containing protein [Clostridiales bacterium]|nr:DUF4430 domain-containing protein [Clostridiales bacterium]
MKKVKFIAFIVLTAMLCTMLAACGNTMTVKVTIKLDEKYINYMYDKNADNEEFIIPQEDRVILNAVPIEIKYKEDEKISVIRVFREAAANFGIDTYQLTEDELSIESIKNYKKEYATIDGEAVTFFWAYTINGVEPKEGRAGTNYVKDGDEVVFMLTSASESEFTEDSKEQ